MRNLNYCLNISIVILAVTARGYTLTLSKAMDMASQNNLPLQQARSTWLTNKNDKNIALSYLLPQISLAQSNSRHGITYPDASNQGLDVKRNYDEKKGSISMTQELFNMNSYYLFSRANQQALQDLLIYQDALQNLSLTVSDQYFQLVLAIENFIFLKSEEDETLKRLRDIEVQVKYGSMTKSQLLEMQAQAKRVQANIIEAQQIINNQKDILADSIGNNQFTKISILGSAPKSLSLSLPALEHWIKDAKDNNLHLKISENNLQQAKLQQKATASNYLPTLSLNANYNHYKYPSQSIKPDNGSASSITGDKLENRKYDGAITLSYPLFNGGKRYYDNLKYQENIKLAKTTQKNDTQVIIRTIKRLYRQLKLGIKVIETQKSALESSKEMLRLSRISLKEGAVTVLETLENISNVRSDQQSLESSRYHYLFSLINLLTESGVISPKDINEISQDLNKIIDIPSVEE
tara:strand:+ start:1774 stop:3168 length:1395 start_codon:yes stop_codon:yes gene_type:complete